MANEAFIAKVEGHGNLHLDWDKNKVWLEVEEGERLFEAMVVGRPAKDLAWITSRICGVCPIAHNLAALKALEEAFNIRLSGSTILLRRLLLITQVLQSHTLHLYFLALPDYLGIDSGVELAKTHPKEFAEALELKRVSDLLADTIGGRGIHPTATAIGGFKKIPSKNKLMGLKAEVEGLLEPAEKTVKLFSSLKYPQVKTGLTFLSLTSSTDYDVYDVKHISSSKGAGGKISEYRKLINEETRAYSTAKFGKYSGKIVTVGALSRLNLSGNLLSGKAKQLYKSSAIDFKNPYHNNLAQAVEIYAFVQEAVKLLNQLAKEGIDEEKTIVSNEDLKPGKRVRGIGALEAPRGGLYYEVGIDSEGLITDCNIITPTVQNLPSMEESAKAVISQQKNAGKGHVEELLEMLIRAYDPCITCSVH
jgi:coenzyme F420-reducing hydrogenase alpha subunit